MKKITLFCCLLILFACNTKGNGNEVIESFPEFTASVPANNTIDLPSGAQEIQLIFNQPVKISDASSIKLNGTSIDKMQVSINTVTVSVFLEAGTKYELFVPKESIKNANNTSLKTDIKLSFSTKKPSVTVSELITPNPSLQAQKLFGFLKEVYGSKTISGAMAKVNWNTEEADWVYEQTGKYPALNCFDFIHHIHSPATWINYDNTEVVEKWWGNNGIVSIMWHWNVPKNMSEINPSEFAFYTKDTNFDISKINDTNSPEYKLMIKDIDIISGYLKLLRDKNIPVIWRPLHEAAGNTNAYTGGTGWFWWGAKGAEPCKALWKLMFDRMTNLHKLNNLIWVWTSQGNDADWYPGDEYVDLVGRDLYPETNIHDSQLSEFNKVKTIVSGKKMIALSECGGIPNPDLMFQKGDTWLWFMPWYGDFTRDDKQNGAAYWKNVMNNAHVITRDKMPNLK